MQRCQVVRAGFAGIQKLSLNGHLMLVTAAFHSFHCNYTFYKMDTSLRRTTDTFETPSTDNWEVLYVVKNTSQRTFGNVRTLHESKLRNV